MSPGEPLGAAQRRPEGGGRYLPLAPNGPWAGVPWRVRDGRVVIVQSPFDPRDRIELDVALRRLTKQLGQADQSRELKARAFYRSPAQKRRMKARRAQQRRDKAARRARERRPED